MGYQPAQDGHALDGILESPRDIIKFFASGYTKPEEVRIGMELEKHGLHRANYAPVSYAEENGVYKIQEKMIEELNWEIERTEEKYITSLHRGGSRMTLEYYESQAELSGRVNPSIHDLARELRIHQNELAEMSRLFDVVWLGIGYDPFHKKDEGRRVKLARFDAVENVMKRSRVWREHWGYLCSVQANIDYTSEEDARKKFQLLLRLSPFLAAMYAHSPLKAGKNTGFVSYRTHLLRKMDRRRFGIRKLFFDPDFNFKKWIDFCGRIPMVAICREGKWLSVKGLNFFQFIKSGHEGFRATMDDWVLHLSFVYTDVRIKKYIELRVCDSLPPALIPSLHAVVKGFVYHPDGLKLITDLTKEWDFRDFATIYHHVAVRGLQAEFRGKKLLDYAKEILEFATANLRALNVQNEKGEDESVHLQPIKEFVFVQEKSPGQVLMEKWDGEWKRSPEKLIEWCGF